MAPLRQQELITIRSFLAQARKREICCALIVALNFPIKRSTSCTRAATANQIHGSVTFVPKHAQMSTNSTHICWVRVINEALITSRLTWWRRWWWHLAKFYDVSTLISYKPPQLSPHHTKLLLIRWRKLIMGIYVWLTKVRFKNDT